MPEEKVSTLGLCDFNTTHETKPHEFHNWCSNWKPLSAADAGPRQPERHDSFWVVERFENDRSAGYWDGASSRSFQGDIHKAIQFCRKEDAFWATRGWHWEDVQLTEHRMMSSAPPVPQEAAPRPDCEMWSSPESSLAFDDELNPDDALATAPDEPLKALRQWEADTEAPANASEGNAFIDGFNAGREAGSERERELTRRLQITLADIDTLLEIADSNVHPKVLDMIKLSRAEASRLLGGESK